MTSDMLGAWYILEKLNTTQVKCARRWDETIHVLDKFALLLGEAQLCLPYVCLYKKIAYIYPKVAYKYPKVTLCYPKVK